MIKATTWGSSLTLTYIEISFAYVNKPISIRPHKIDFMFYMSFVTHDNKPCVCLFTYANETSLQVRLRELPHLGLEKVQKLLDIWLL